MIQLLDASPGVTAVVGAVRLPVVAEATPDWQTIDVALEDFSVVELFETRWRRHFAREDGLDVEFGGVFTGEFFSPAFVDCFTHGCGLFLVLPHGLLFVVVRHVRSKFHRCAWYLFSW